jgi:hypothetical protein
MQDYIPRQSKPAYGRAKRAHSGHFIIFKSFEAAAGLAAKAAG